MKSIPFTQWDTSYPQGGIMSEKNIESSICNQNIHYGQTNDIVPSKTVLRKETINLILKCIDVLECFIKNFEVKGNEVQLINNGYYGSLQNIFANDGCVYNDKRISGFRFLFLKCIDLFKVTSFNIERYSILEKDPEYKEVNGGISSLMIDVFSDNGFQLIEKNFIPFSYFCNLVDVAFKLYSFLNKYSGYQVNVSNEHIDDGYVYIFFSYLLKIYNSVFGFLKRSGLDLSEEELLVNINGYISKNRGDKFILFDLLKATMLKYYDFHKELVRICGEKVIDGGFDFHSKFINLMTCLDYVYGACVKVSTMEGKVNVGDKFNIGTFVMHVKDIENFIKEIFKFFNSNSGFFNEQKKVIEEGNIERVFIYPTHKQAEGNKMFSGLVYNIIKKKRMYENINEGNLEDLNNNYNHLSMNYINNGYYLNNASFYKEGNVKKPLGEIIDNVASNRSSCCCPCQVRSR